MSKIFEQKEEQLLENEVESTLPSLTKEDIDTLRYDDLRADADSRDADLAEGWEPN